MRQRVERRVYKEITLETENAALTWRLRGPHVLDRRAVFCLEVVVSEVVDIGDER